MTYTTPVTMAQRRPTSLEMFSKGVEKRKSSKTPALRLLGSSDLFRAPSAKTNQVLLLEIKLTAQSRSCAAQA